MIGYHILTNCIANSKGDICQEAPFDRGVEMLLDWLLEDHPGDEPRVFYDLDAGVASLLALMGISRHDGEKLAKHTKLYMAPYRLTYYPGRFFGIDRGFGPLHSYVNFSNMAQYGDVHFEPDTSPEYAVKKAKEAEAIGEGVAQALRRLGLSDKKLTSPIAAFEREMMPDLPTVDDIPEGAAEIAYGCVKGTWMEAFKLGYWPRAYDYDISGAYGSELAKLLDLRRGRWEHGNDPNLRKEALYGFAKGHITCWAEFHPFLANLGTMTYTPVGTWEACLTKQEIDFLEDHELGEFEIIEDAWWWIPQGQQYELLKGLINWLWAKRQDTEGYENEVVKRILTGLWGKLLEVRGTEDEPELGPHFNPVYGAVVEANTRLKVAMTCLRQGIVPLHVAVDGMITDEPLEFLPRRGLGDWRLSHEGQCIIASSGVVAFEGKHGEEEFSLRFDWLVDQLQRRPRAKEYEMSKLSPCTLARALNTDFEKLGQVEEVSRSVKIGEEPKRMWRQHPKNGADLLNVKFDSAPWEYGVLAQAKVLEV